MKRLFTLVLLMIFVVVISGCIQQISEKPVETAEEQKEDFLPTKVSQAAKKTQELLEETAIDEKKFKEPSPPQVQLPTAAKKPLTFEEKFWKERIDAALTFVSCADITPPKYPASYYRGPLIDTHLHIPGLADWPADEGPPETQPPEWYEEDDERNIQWGEDAFLGHNINIGTIDCTLKQEGTIKALSYFPIYPEIPQQQLEVANRTSKEYPNRIVPFISPTEDKTPTVTATKLEEMLSVYPGLFKGYGEIGIYDTVDWKADDFPPDAPLFLKTYPIIEKHNLIVYFHPGERHEDNFKRVLRDYPNITFIVHGEEIEESIGDLMDDHKNIYYTVDFSFGEYFPLFVGKSKEEFITKVEKDFDQLIADDLRRWKTLIEQHPNRFMWGTDRGDAVWNYDQDVGLFLAKYARAFIGKLNPSVQEKFAYKNAQRLLSQRQPDSDL